MTNRMIYGASAGVVGTGAIVALALLGGGLGGDAPIALAQGSRTASPKPSTRVGAAPTTAGTVAPAVEDLHRETTQPAHIESYERTDVYAKASGFLKTLLVDIGDRVKQDQVLAELWIPEMDQEVEQALARVEQARAAVSQSVARLATAEALVVAAQARVAEENASIAAAEADVELRRREHGRIAELVRTRSATEALEDEKLFALQSADASLTAAKARVATAAAQVQVDQTRKAEAEANLSFARSQLKLAEADQAQTAILMQYAQIRAPYDGLVTRRRFDTGDFVTSAAATKTEPLFMVERIDRLRITFDVPESESSLIAVGQPAVLRVDALKGRTFSARVRRSAGILDPRTRTLRVEAELDEPEPVLRAGMYGMVTVTLVDIPQAVLLPTPCIQHDRASSSVHCVVDGKMEQRIVQTGYSDAVRTQIIAGVGPGDLVLVDPPVSKGEADDRLSHQ